MRRSPILFVALSVWLAPAVPAQTGPAGASPEATAPSAPDEAALHDELRQLRQAMVEALNGGDVEEMLKHLHRNVIFTAMNAEVCRGPEQVRAYFDRMMKGPGRVVESIRVDPQADALSDLYGGQVAVAYGSSRDDYRLTNGLTMQVNSRWTCSLVREGGRWLITGFHSSASVFDNPVLARAKTAIFKAGGIAAILGLVIGWLFGRLRKKASQPS
jgi:ketosteroid isomerase-like protein